VLSVEQVKSTRIYGNSNSLRAARHEAPQLASRVDLLNTLLLNHDSPLIADAVRSITTRFTMIKLVVEYTDKVGPRGRL